MSKRIKLTQGKYAIVDDEDYEYLNQWKWYAFKSKTTFYGRRKMKKDTLHMHRVILGINNNIGKHVDHINHNGLDNRKSNLRLATYSQNRMNSQKIQGTSIYKGVYWNKKLQKWYAHIMLHKEKIYLGLFINEIDAAKAYDLKAKEIFGEYAVLNF